MIWAIATRCHVREGIDIVKDVWASVCEPALPPEERSPRGYTSDRVLIDACRPYKWMDQFPAVNAFKKNSKTRSKASGKFAFGKSMVLFQDFNVKLGANG